MALHTRSVAAGVGVLVAFILFIAQPAHAVTTQNTEAQRLVVMEHLVATLQEHVTLVQLMVIQRLEARVALLENLVEAQNK